MEIGQQTQAVQSAVALTLSLPRVINGQISPAASSESYITQNEELAFHSLLRRKMIILPVLTTSLLVPERLRVLKCGSFFFLGSKSASTDWRNNKRDVASRRKLAPRRLGRVVRALDLIPAIWWDWRELFTSRLTFHFRRDVQTFAVVSSNFCRRCHQTFAVPTEFFHWPQNNVDHLK